MKKLMMIVAMVAVIAAGFENASAANIALTGTGIMGVNPNDDGTLGTPFANYPATNLNDNDFVSFAGNNDEHSSDVFNYAGVTFGSLVAGINQIVVYEEGYVNGGWFGTTPPTTVVAPKVQSTVDGGTTWTDVAGVTDDYVAAHGGPLAAPLGDLGPATFNFAALGPVDGVRLFGKAGGGDNDTPPRPLDGFIIVRELQVFTAPPVVVPEPAGLGLIGLALLAVRKRRS